MDYLCYHDQTVTPRRSADALERRTLQPSFQASPPAPKKADGLEVILVILSRHLNVS